MMASHHSALRNDTIFNDRTATIRRRKNHPSMNNHHHNHHHSRNSRSNALRDSKVIADLQLQQAVRSLQCFEGLQEHCDTSYRTFALEYIEDLLRRWSHQVKQQSQTWDVCNTSVATGTQHPSRRPLHITAHPGKSIETVSVKQSTRTFAAVVAANAGNIKEINTSITTPIIPNPTKPLVAGAKPPNVWNRPPTIIRMNDENIPKSIPNAWNRPSSILSITKLKNNNMDYIITPALIPFGSYRLGVHSVASDLDLLTLAPPYITRHDFFTSLVSILQRDTRCKNVHPIPTAYTPVIKFVLLCGDENATVRNDIHIDLVFARVTDTTKLVEYHKREKLQNPSNRSSVQYHLDDTDLQDQDEIGIRSLNGARVTQMILESVRNDVRKFQIVLCAVKCWAQVRGLYSNILGLLGGVNWAILVAWVCTRYPDANVSKTLHIFFDTFSKWQWNTPVLLGDAIADTPPICDPWNQTFAIQLPAWNPAVNPRDGLHLMPIITPAYPSMNSSYNVDVPQLRCIQHEMIKTNVMLSQSSSSTSNNWNTPQSSMGNTNIYTKLFEPPDFFQRHRHYIQINISSTNEADFTKWFRLVESKLRNLISSLETTEVHAWPFARFFDVGKYHPETKKNDETSTGTPHATSSLGGCNSEYEKSFFIGLQFEPGIDATDIQHLTMDFLYKVNHWDGRDDSTMGLTLAYLSAGDVPLYALEAMKVDSLVKPIVPIKTVSLCNSKDGSIGSGNTAPASDDEDDFDLHDEFCSSSTY